MNKVIQEILMQKEARNDRAIDNIALEAPEVGLAWTVAE